MGDGGGPATGVGADDVDEGKGHSDSYVLEAMRQRLLLCVLVLYVSVLAPLWGWGAYR